MSVDDEGKCVRGLPCNHRGCDLNYCIFSQTLPFMLKSHCCWVLTAQRREVPYVRLN